MEHANLDLLYEEIKLLHKEVEKNNALILSLIPEVKISKAEAERLRKLKAEMDAGDEVPYSKDLF